MRESESIIECCSKYRLSYFLNLEYIRPEPGARRNRNGNKIDQATHPERRCRSPELAVTRASRVRGRGNTGDHGVHRHSHTSIFSRIRQSRSLGTRRTAYISLS